MTRSSFPLSFSTVALAIGLLFTGLISERFGRKLIMVWVLFLAASLLILSSILPVWEIFLSTRVLIGISVSGVVAVAMTYIRTLFLEQLLVEWVGVLLPELWSILFLGKWQP